MYSASVYGVLSDYLWYRRPSSAISKKSHDRFLAMADA
jgi:hypothetical protein